MSINVKETRIKISDDNCDYVDFILRYRKNKIAVMPYNTDGFAVINKKELAQLIAALQEMHDKMFDNNEG